MRKGTAEYTKRAHDLATLQEVMQLIDGAINRYDERTILRLKAFEAMMTTPWYTKVWHRLMAMRAH